MLKCVHVCHKMQQKQGPAYHNCSIDNYKWSKTLKHIFNDGNEMFCYLSVYAGCFHEPFLHMAQRNAL